MVAWLKSNWPECHITFLCRNYTAPIVSCYDGVDSVLRLEELEALPPVNRVAFIIQQQFDTVIHVFPRKELAQLFKKAKVPDRIGTSHRGFHLLTCNIRPNFSRKRSAAHEAQLNFELMRPLGVTQLPDMEQLNQWTYPFQVHETPLPDFIEIPLKLGKKIIVLHPKSQGSAREWPMDRYLSLAEKLIEKDYIVYFSGTEKEGAQFRNLLPKHENCIDTTGHLSIEQLLFLIKQSFGLVACSTGPLHIAGFLEKHAVGLYSPRIPIHPGRWKPLGKYATALVFDPECAACKAKKPCNCIEQITVDTVLRQLME